MYHYYDTSDPDVTHTCCDISIADVSNWNNGNTGLNIMLFNYQ